MELTMCNRKRAGLPLMAAIVIPILTSGCNTGLVRVPASGTRAPSAVPIILDTDIGTDIDDAGALAVLHALASRSEARILAVMSANSNFWSAPAIDVINTYYGRPDIPVGASRTGPCDELWYHDSVPAFPHDLTASSEAPEAVDLYRKILANEPDRSVTIVTIGWLTNLGDLLDSRPDTHSPLPGRELVAAKVTELVTMGGIWPNNAGEGEYNFKMDLPAARKVVQEWPGPIMFTGLGINVMTGSRLMAVAPERNPVRAFYGNFLQTNKVAERSSWDLIAVLYAVRGLSGYFTADSKGQCVVRGKGTAWEPGENHKNHAYLIYKMAPPDLASEIEDLMLMPPNKSPHHQECSR